MPRRIALTAAILFFQSVVRLSSGMADEPVNTSCIYSSLYSELLLPLPAALLFLFFPGQSQPPAPAKPAQNSRKLEAQVRAITKSAILIDTHNDIPSFTVDGADIGNSPNTHTDIKRLREGGVGAVFFSVYVDAKYVLG